VRRYAVGALMMLLCLLTACGQGGRKGEEQALQIRTELVAMASCSGEMEVNADYGDRVYDFVLDFSYTKDGNTVLTVAKPENLAGISVTVEKGETKLTYDGASLETGLLSQDGLSPISAFPTILKNMIDGYISETALEQLNDKQTIHVSIRDPEKSAGSGTETDIWFDATTHAPVQAEISQDGYTVIRCNFLTFTME
jgi:outer membrane lipoprotein-sorting protein